MNKILLFILFGLFYLFHVEKTIAQDSLSRFSIEFDMRLVPVMRSFYSNDIKFFNIKTKQANSENIIIQTNHNFRISYSARLNYNSKNENFLIGLALRYSKSTNYGLFIRTDPDFGGHKLAENMVADYIGGNFRILSSPKSYKGNIKHGITVGGGILQGRSENALVTYDYEELPSKPPPSKKKKFKANDISSINLGYKVSLNDLYLNYTFQYYYIRSKKTACFFGFEVPLLRYFKFNDIGRFGISLNDEHFFTSFESYTILAGDQVSANKNFAYSMKKMNSLSLNFGISYFLN